MTWKTRDVESERKLFVQAYLTGRYTVVELAQRFEISERVAHKTLNRFKKDGFKGLSDRPRVRLTQVRADPDVIARVVAGRKLHPTWGPRKLRAWLQKRDPRTNWPAPSTMGGALKAVGLVEPRHRRRGRPTPTRPCVEARAPNQSWSMDHKGHFAVGGRRCYPFTVTDNFSRAILCCDTTASTNLEEVWQSLTRTFRTYGLPESILSDNGSPFAGTGLTHLSQLSVRLMKLGIHPEYIEPGKPQQNGRHERMHRTLKAETAAPPASTFEDQQKRFCTFVREFNEERPHEALGNEVPASVHVRSVREMPSTLPKMEYDQAVTTRAVNRGGCFKWKAEFIFLAEPLYGERVAFDPAGEGLFAVRFGETRIAMFDEIMGRLHPVGPQLQQEG